MISSQMFRGIVFAFLACLTVAPTWAQGTDKIKRLEKGDKAIDFELPTVGTDDFLTLEDEYEKGPVVVVFLRGYPGYQCPICTRQMAAIINRAKAIGKFAHRLILVYPGEQTELKRHSEQFLGSRKLPEPLVMVRDPGMKTITKWGIRWDARRETAYPATYVINQNGRVAWSKVSTSHSGRSTVEEILAALRKL